MKRKRLILTTALLACVAAVVVPYRREIWLAVAYVRLEPAFVDAGISGYYVPVLAKRSSWIPGGEYVLERDIECLSCVNGHHPQQCEAVQVHPIDRTSFDRPCTCPDPSHEWDR